MWLLENDGDVFHGKRLWLRPGKKFIFGRTLADAGGFVIENKTISRKHLVIELLPVNLDDSTKPDTRSKVILEDLNTKIGTLVNGNQIRGQRHEPVGDRHEIKLGQFDRLFRITWYPVVLSLSLTSKELQADLLPSFRERLNPLDIIVLAEYSRADTTHVVAKKRNTSKGLQALINGKYIVDYKFIDDIIEVTRTENDEFSPLESDFHLNWPNELQYLPPRGTEPTQRPADAYAPAPERQEIFDGYTFVFCDQLQFDNLLAPITNGRGKALLRQVDPYTTKIEDFIRFVKDVAGEKGLGEFEDGSEGKGVVVVRYQPAKGPTSEWYADFGRRVALQLDQRLIEQKEFLDAILNNNASVLRKPLELEQSDVVAPPSTLVPAHWPMPREAQHTLQISSTTDRSERSGETLEITPLISPTPVRRAGRLRRAVTSRFKGFDEDFDMAVIPEITSVAGAHAPISDVSNTQGPGTLLSQVNERDIYSKVAGAETNVHSSRKRSSPRLVGEDDEGDVLDQLAPIATDLKRRRLADDIGRQRRGESIQSQLPEVVSKAESLKLGRRKVKAEVDVIEVARQQRVQEEAIMLAEREALQEAMNGIEINQIRNIAVIVETEVRRSNPPLRAAAQADDSSRWDERWNGRKNFKKFRRIGEGPSRFINKVIVPLEEVKKRDFGIGDEYWLEGERGNSKKRNGKTRDGETQIVDGRQSQPTGVRRVADDGSTVENLDAMDLSTQHLRSQSQRISGRDNQLPKGPSQNKRMPEAMTKPAPTKKARHVIMGESDDSEDGLGFRFQKKS